MFFYSACLISSSSCFLQLIRFFMSYNLTVRGLRVENSPQFHVKFDGCEGVHIEDLSIRSPALSPNTDGIHIENTKSVAIYNSVISNGLDSTRPVPTPPPSLPEALILLFHDARRRRLHLHRSGLFQRRHSQCYLRAKPWHQVQSFLLPE